MGISEPLEASRGHAFATHAPSISSAASTMGGGRVRFVRLIRRPGESYGFSLRGGREHGTGFFISHVEVGSEAYMQGLRVRKQRFCSSYFFIVFLFVCYYWWCYYCRFFKYWCCYYYWCCWSECYWLCWSYSDDDKSRCDGMRNITIRWRKL